MIRLDLHHTFFSRRGAYLSISHTDRDVPAGLYLRHLRGALLQPELFSFQVMRDGRPLPFTTDATPSRLQLMFAGGTIQICFETTDTLRIIGSGAALQLLRDTARSPYDCALPRGNGRLEINAYSSELKCLFTPLQGRIDIAAPYDGLKAASIAITLVETDGLFDITLQTYRSTPSPFTPAPDFTSAAAEVENEFSAWLKHTLPVPAAWEPGRALAAYLNWAGMVAAEGNLSRPAMFMSKNWMNKIWGWDNCFNAIAHIRQDPELAWDQLMLFVDNQGADGAFPDHITDTTRSFRFYKPPVYGWAIRQMQARSSWITPARLAEIYPALCRWTEWWFTYRDDDGDGLPQYNHGNESGWDNGTPFARFLPVESPDLATFLILQMEFLAETAALLNLGAEADHWADRANHLLALLLEQLWDGAQFVARHALTHEPAPRASLLLTTPLLLGDRLPAAVRTSLVKSVNRFLTPYGAATEPPDSPFYEADGYWRGPIWAPSSYILVDGLRQCGAVELADEIARRFCETAVQYGMAENFNALRGTGLRDRAYTWTSGVFLLLAADIDRQEQASIKD